MPLGRTAAFKLKNVFFECVVIDSKATKNMPKEINGVSMLDRICVVSNMLMIKI
jgi:hypothetical protein